MTSKTKTTPKAQTKLEQLEKLLQRPKGASLSDMMEATGWQSHSVRGALAGALKKRGNTITSEKLSGVRCYRIEKAS